MRSRLLFLTVLLIIICVSCRPKKKTEPEKKAVTGATYTNPLRERGAEPWAVFHEGKYYYTQGSESRIMLWETSDITNLNDSLRKPVWIPTDPSNSHHLWAPEMHRINNGKAIYISPPKTIPINITGKKITVQSNFIIPQDALNPKTKNFPTNQIIQIVNNNDNIFYPS